MFITNMMAVSLDGCIAYSADEMDETRRYSGFSSAYDQQLLREAVEASDAIIIGANSVRASKRLLANKNDKGVYPLWVVMTVRGIEAEHCFWQQEEIERWLVSPAPVTQHGTINLKNYCYQKNSPPASFVVSHLQQRNIKRVLLFGGSEINLLFYRHNFIDELHLTISPFILANKDAPSLLAPSLPTPVKLRLLSCLPVDNHIFLRYQVLNSENIHQSS